MSVYAAIDAATPAGGALDIALLDILAGLQESQTTLNQALEEVSRAAQIGFRGCPPQRWTIANAFEFESELDPSRARGADAAAY